MPSSEINHTQSPYISMNFWSEILYFLYVAFFGGFVMTIIGFLT